MSSLIVQSREPGKLVVQEREKGKLVVTSPGPQGPPGPAGPAGGDTYATRPFENADSVVLPAGTPVRRFGTGVVRADLTHPAMGIMMANCGIGVAGSVILSGFLQIPNWNLSPGSTYYLGNGEVTNTPPTTGGFLLQILGHAVSDQTLAVSIEPPIRL